MRIETEPNRENPEPFQPYQNQQENIAGKTGIKRLVMAAVEAVPERSARGI